MALVCGHVTGHGLFDYVAAWCIKAASYISGTRCRVAFVSTNSICQGEQVGVLWPALFEKGIKIHFAHTPFAWESEAKGKAHVHVVIIGFGAFDYSPKKIYEYVGTPDGMVSGGVQMDQTVTVIEVPNISPRLVAGPDITLTARSKPISPVPEIVFGSMPNDGGHLLLDRIEREDLLAREPGAAKFVRRFVGAEEFLNGVERWCIWLHGHGATEFRHMPAVMERVRAVAAHRRKSKRPTTRKLAEIPAFFGEIRQPDRPYLLIPSVSSERRRYIPIAFMRPDVIASNLVLLVPGADLYHFGVLSSAMHMAWVRRVAGRLESRYRYSNKIVYNNFPWPDSPSEAKRARVYEAAQRILDLRKELGDGRAGYLSTRKGPGQFVCLADLYDREAMPLSLYKAHAALDRAVDRCYRSQPFTSESQRVNFLFGLYEKLTAPLIPDAAKKKRSARPSRGGTLPLGPS